MNSKSLCAVAAALALGLAACGDDDDESASTGTTTEEQTTTPSGPAGQTVNISETEFKITPAQLNLQKGGSVEFKVTNDGGTTHALEVEQGETEFETEDIAPGSSATLKADLQPGEYELYCPIDDHKGKGMTATLTVGGAASSGGTTTTEDDEGDEDSGSDDSGSDDDSGGTGAPGSDDSGGASARDDSGY